MEPPSRGTWGAAGLLCHVRGDETTFSACPQGPAHPVFPHCHLEGAQEVEGRCLCSPSESTGQWRPPLNHPPIDTTPMKTPGQGKEGGRNEELLQSIKVSDHTNAKSGVRGPAGMERGEHFREGGREAAGPFLPSSLTVALHVRSSERLLLWPEWQGQTLPGPPGHPQTQRGGTQGWNKGLFRRCAHRG